jgi:hypothetical protein
MSSGRDVGLKRPNLRPKPVNVQCRWYQYKTQVIVQSLRTSGEGGAFERHAEIEPRRSAPELRHHRETEERLEG